MYRLEKLQRISAALRYLVIAIGAGVAIIALTGQLVFDQWWLDTASEPFNRLWQQRADLHGPLLALVMPAVIFALLGFYWLQRLFAIYQRGEFFSQPSMGCYLWLVWLKVASFIYGALLPILLVQLAPSDEPVAIVINFGDFFTLLLLLVTMYLLKAAQAINQENREFV